MELYRIVCNDDTQIDSKESMQASAARPANAYDFIAFFPDHRPPLFHHPADGHYQNLMRHQVALAG
ncbi:hypothetical protein SAMN05518865_101371 [Duganella sp. CF458]|nr:hypothetical protein SAMN05518865_101371 [Duganella sp. CF458]